MSYVRLVERFVKVKPCQLIPQPREIRRFYFSEINMTVKHEQNIENNRKKKYYVSFPLLHQNRILKTIGKGNIMFLSLYWNKRFNTKNKKDKGRMLSSILFNLYIVWGVCINPNRPPYHPLCTPAHLTCPKGTPVSIPATVCYEIEGRGKLYLNFNIYLQFHTCRCPCCGIKLDGQKILWNSVTIRGRKKQVYNSGK